MIKIRAKLILAFAATILICSIATLAVTFGGYNMMVSGIAASADSNNSRIISVREISGMVHEQYRNISRAVMARDVSLLDDLETRYEKIGQAVTRLASQSEESERAELEKLSGLAEQFVRICKTDIVKGIERSDPAGYQGLLADFTSRYDSLIQKETELKDMILGQADAVAARLVRDAERLGSLSSEQLEVLGELLPSAEKVLQEYKSAIDANRSLLLLRDGQQIRIGELESQIEALLEEISRLKAELDELKGQPLSYTGQNASGRAAAQAGAGVTGGAGAAGGVGANAAGLQAGASSAGLYASVPSAGLYTGASSAGLYTGASSAGVQDQESMLMSGSAEVQAGPSSGINAVYDQALAESVQEYLDSVLLKGTDIRSIVSGLTAAGNQKALQKLTSINAAITLTAEAYGRAQAGMAAGSSEETEASREAARSAAAELERLASEPGAEYAVLAAEAAKECGQLEAAIAPLAEARRALEDTGLSESFAHASGLYDQQIEVLGKLETSYKTYLADDIERSQKLKNSLLLTLAGIAFVSLFIGMFAALWLSGNILVPIRSMTRLLDKASRGDLTGRVSDRRRDEIGELGEKVNIVLDGQQKMIEQVKATSTNIGKLKNSLAELFTHSRENTGKVSSGFRSIMQSLMAAIRAPGTDSTAATADDTAEVLAVTTGKAVEEGMKAIELAASGERSVQEAEEVIRNVTDTVKQIADSINELEESSDKIGNITDTITEIASKTNLLALNAAIEAARAGQQGKGFTVLAEEIRKLSERSNDAAKGIRQLISEIQERIQYAVVRIGDGVAGVDVGVGKINHARSSILEITDVISQVVETLRSTANSISSRHENTAELTGAMSTLEQTASETVASGEEIDAELELQQKTIREMEAVTEKLDEVTGALNELLGKFRI
ncbi:MAG TPA: methyl-accepting chemotaxis protein [Clostridiales bacterium]|nr:methyl-accepting chemotaxis protein [Clostridiales bacterium]